MNPTPMIARIGTGTHRRNGSPFQLPNMLTPTVRWLTDAFFGAPRPVRLRRFGDLRGACFNLEGCLVSPGLAVVVEAGVSNSSIGAEPYDAWFQDTEVEVDAIGTSRR